MINKIVKAVITLVTLLVLQGAWADTTTAALSLATVIPASEVRSRRQGNYVIQYSAAQEGMVPDIIARADAARREVNRATGDALMASVELILAPDRKSFLKLVGDWAENSAAVAVPRARQIVLNRDVFAQSPPEQLPIMLIHEFAHIYNGTRCTRPLPRWLDEGIAMNVAGEWTSDDAAAIVLARLVGRLMPLSSLEQSFPNDAGAQKLAYRQAYSVVRFMVGQSGNSLPVFLETITGPQGAKRIEELWGPPHRDGLELAWRKSLRSGVSWVLLLSSSGVFWGAVVILALGAWLVRWRRGRALRREWDDEERLYSSLGEEDRLIWGDEDDPDSQDDEIPFEER